jgi:dTDP-glucose 4,6-dehydratase
MKYLITGGAGFIGSNFIKYLLNNYPECSIVNLDKLTYCGNLDNLKDIEKDPRYKFTKGDITDEKIANELIKDADIVVNFAAETHVDRSIVNPEDFLKTNILGIYVLLEAARKYDKRFHQISSDEVFGALSLESEEKFKEDTSYAPRSPYSASKAAADHLVRAYFHTYGLKTTISNCGNNYGPYQFPEKFIPLGITNLIEWKKVPVYGDGLYVRDWIYVLDHCSAIDAVLQKGKIGKSYCISSEEEKANIEVARRILKEFNLPEDRIEFVKDRPGHDRRYAVSAEKIKKELGWKAEYSFERGIKETIKWYKENKEWWLKLKEKARFERF